MSCVSTQCEPHDVYRTRHESVMNEARRMARSGEYADSKQIEVALREEDLAESLDVIGGYPARVELDQLCRESRGVARECLLLCNH